MKLRLSILVLAFIPSILFAQTCKDKVQILQWVENANPLEDAAKALENGNANFMAVNGYGLYIPGMENAPEGAFEKRGYIVIEGTSDALCSKRHLKLNNIALEYAKSYNHALLGGK
ncbi:MAG: hypothetical protein KBT66_12690 [Amphritea sp.]|nr:hypothetical protein [Amphritea sp.]